MMVRHIPLGFVIVIAGMWASFALAATTEPFTAERFAAAQAAGKPILVEITAPWCPTCVAQQPILADLTSQSKFSALDIFKVDFDSQQDIVRGMHANMQSTLLCYKGAVEVARSVGVTSRAWIARQLDKTM